MNTISRFLFSRLSSLVSRLVLAFLLFLMCACDFQGPWSYYPEETETYRGIQTYGYVVANRESRICFAKTYALDETEAESFAFYDSAYVTVKGKFAGSDDSLQVLTVESGKPNCFTSAEGVLGIAGESYSMYAFFAWDSAGSNAKTVYTADTRIPSFFEVAGVRPPGRGVASDQPFYENTREYMDFEFLEYPFDMYTYNIALHYDETVMGVTGTMYYDNVNGGESQNTTMMHMVEGMMDPDSMGYYGFSTNEPFEHARYIGFEGRTNIGGINNLDTMMMSGMSTPIGKVKVIFYATDQSYYDYENYVIESFSDPRIVARTNIENGMGVFSGMNPDSILLNIHSGNYISYDYMKASDCDENEMDSDQKPWDTKYCRLYQDQYCVGDSANLNKKETCYGSLVKYAMAREESGWSYFLPTDIDADKKNEAYGDGLKRYCVSSNFASNSIADCKQMKTDCLESKDKTNCMEYLWTWCADRNWDMDAYPQCGSGLVSRYYLEEVNSPILKRVVKNWCAAHADDKQCKR